MTQWYHASINISSLLNTPSAFSITKAAKQMAATARRMWRSARFTGNNIEKHPLKRYIILQITLAIFAILLICTYILAGFWWAQPPALLLMGVTLGMEVALKLGGVRRE